MSRREPKHGQGIKFASPCRAAGGRGIMALAMLMPLVAFAATPPAQAGQARAQFKASLRIDARLVERDLAIRKGAITSASVEPATLASAARTAPSAAAARLPRADGSGFCRRQPLGNGLWRWKCR